MQKTVVELFAGVGGFRCGLNNVKLKDNKVINNFPILSCPAEIVIGSILDELMAAEDLAVDFIPLTR